MTDMTDKARTAVDNLESCVNAMGGREEAANYVVERMLLMHRTLNQALTGNIVIPFVKKMAENYATGNYDGRNEAAVKACYAMAQAIKDIDKLPFI